MNPTFTIESVHGVKQTIVLVPTEQNERYVQRSESTSDRDGGDRQRERQCDHSEPTAS